MESPRRPSRRKSLSGCRSKGRFISIPGDVCERRGAVVRKLAFLFANAGLGMDTLNTEELHSELVEQLRQKQLLSDPGVEKAFAAVPRHLFLPRIDPREVYLDRAIALSTSASGVTHSSASQPTMMAIMLGQLDLRAGMNVLEIGAASGYNAALIRHIVGARGHVTSLEIDLELAEAAQNHLHGAGFSDVLVVNRDGVSGYEPRAQYDRIIATAGIWDVPVYWLRQLRAEGKLVAPFWLDGVQMSAAFDQQADGSWLSRDNRPCAFVYLQGLAAGPRIRKRVGSTSLEILADEVDKIDTAALHALISDDLEMQHLGANPQPEDFWFGFQLYLMLNEPQHYVFAVYAIPDGETAYGMEGKGVLLFTPNSVAFAPYEGGGSVFSYGSGAAFMEMQALYDDWKAVEDTLLERMRLRLIPISNGEPTMTRGKLFTRKDHYLHVWQD